MNCGTCPYRFECYDADDYYTGADKGEACEMEGE